MANSKRATRNRSTEPEDPVERKAPAVQAGTGDVFSLEFLATLTAIVHPEPAGGFSAEVSALPGCFTQGETLEELRENLREAAEGWLEAQEDLATSDAHQQPTPESGAR